MGNAPQAPQISTSPRALMRTRIDIAEDQHSAIDFQVLAGAHGAAVHMQLRQLFGFSA